MEQVSGRVLPDTRFVTERVCHIVETYFDRKVTPATEFEDLWCTSLDKCDFGMDVEDEFGIAFDREGDEEFRWLKVQDVIDSVNRKLQEAA